MKNYVQSNLKGLIIVAVACVIMIGIFKISDDDVVEEFEGVTFNYVIPTVESEKVITEEERLELVINEHLKEITFYADMFQIDKNVLIEKLMNNYTNLNLLGENIVFDKILFDYVSNLELTENGLFGNQIHPCNKGKDYITALVRYFSSLFGNVDTSIALAIAEVESGYSAPFMLNKNNIFGGMAGGRLIGYKTIEYGVYSYVKLLSEGYFSKGLNTVETIGLVYNPTFNEYGIKIAKPSWVEHVNNAKSKYLELPVITIANIIEIKESF